MNVKLIILIELMVKAIVNFKMKDFEVIKSESMHTVKAKKITGWARRKNI